MSEEDWLSEEEQKEIDEHEIRKFNRERAWKDNQLDRVENKINRIESTLRNISFFGGVLLIIIVGVLLF